MGDARYIKGANVEAVLAVAGAGQLEEAIPPLEWYFLRRRGVVFAVVGLGARKGRGLDVTGVVQSREGAGE